MNSLFFYAVTQEASDARNSELSIAISSNAAVVLIGCERTLKLPRVDPKYFPTIRGIWGIRWHLWGGGEQKGGKIGSTIARINGGKENR